jgi:Raf kinase inhibitor-like YbhB/YbcL family protein
MDHYSFPSEHEKAISYRRIDVSSDAFNENGFIPPRYTCDGEDVNPALNFDHIPEEAQSLAIIVDDPDAPAGTWVHWVIWNIPVTHHLKVM